MDLYIVLSTAGSSREGQKIARNLVEKGLAGCVNVIPRVKSFFFYGGKLCRETETMMVIKTVKKNLEKMMKNIKEMHSYSIPEMIFLKVEGGEKKYVKWLEEMAAYDYKKNIDKKNLKR
jgi:periplasmic divalent cation tolerance protein